MFKIIDIVETKDGGVDLELDYDKEFAEQIKVSYGWKRLTKQRLEWFVNNALLKYIDDKKTLTKPNPK